jgi:carboxyl-terminal processing protease
MRLDLTTDNLLMRIVFVVIDWLKRKVSKGQICMAQNQQQFVRDSVKRWSKSVAALGLALTMGCSGPVFAPFTPSVSSAATLSCQNIDKIAQVFLNQHILHKDANEALEARVIEQYVKRLDSAKIYMLESDVAQIKKDMKGIFGQLRKGDCKTLDKVQALFVKRVQERATFAKKTLTSKKFKFDPKTELNLNPDTRGYPKTIAAADAFQSKYLQFQISNYLATGLKQSEALEQVGRNYERVLKRVKETSREDLFTGYLDSFGRSLDPHSSYFSKDVLEDFEIQMGLSLEGIGATLSNQDGFTVIEQLIDGGSAKASGQLRPQDKITAVGQFKPTGDLGEMENVVELDLRDVVRKIRGPKGTKVRLQILRKTAEGGTERLVVDLVRDKIKLEDEAAALSFQERDVNGEKRRIAVLNLPSFYADSKRGGRSSAQDTRNLLKEAKAKGADALVFDLSQNGGGSLDDAVKIAGLFFKTGAVVKQSSRDATQPESALEDRDPTVEWEGPMVVLTSRVSASASEIVAGTLKDYNRAVVIGGDHTFGKGSVQSVIPLPPGLGAVKSTVGMFFTPGGFSTQHRGVEADIVLPGPFATDEFGEKHLDHSLPPKQIKSFLSPEAYVTQGPGAWQKVDSAVINQLRARSEIRVARNADFQKITEELKKSKDKNKIIKLSEALKDTKEKKGEADQKKNMSKEEKAADYAKRADIQEAVSVVADLLALQRGIILTDASLKSTTEVANPADPAVEGAKKTR